ncbi:MAG: hypothetical protein F3741_07945 [Nitrospinae bacterium]|nr:hypothetical protein [Nitrospinota bacterium]MZH40500.1 hypothetical protein [Nitrospinota bacterium]
MNLSARLLNLLTAIGCFAIAGIAIAYFLINEKFEWIPESALELVRVKELLERPEAKRCSECHKEIYDAWKESRHSISWTSKTYIEASEDRTKEKCLACHIPESVTGEKPSPRLDRRDEGIYCVSCHFIDGKMNGPYDLVAPPHPTYRNPDYVNSKLCGSCHQKTFKEWKETGIEDTCQDCHMPRKKDWLTQKFPLNLLHKKKWVGNHEFLHGDLTEKDIQMEAQFKNNFFNLSLLNKTIPHWVPTADNGDPRLYLYITFLDSAGEKVDQAKEIIAPQQETALPYQKKVNFRYRLFDSVAKAGIALKYQPAWSKEKELIWEKTIQF